jgi:hypothetical protein
MREWQRVILLDLEAGVRLLRRDALLMRYSGPKGVNELDRMIGEVDVEATPNAALVCLLTTTAVVANQLRNREMFYKQVRDKMGEAPLEGLACEEAWGR